MDYPSTNHDRVQGCDFPKLPKQLDEIPSAKEFPLFRHRWNSNEEVAAILTAFDKHKEWMSLEVKIRPPSGSMILYSRKKVRYKKDGYCWKKRKGGKNIREDHMKLKVQGLECIYGSYVHSDILPTFHRRCYWLLQNPDIVLIHYLNVPYPDDGKVKIPMMPCSTEKKEWTKEELVEQLRPMFSAGSSDQMLEETVETLVKHLIQYHESQDKVKVQNVGFKKISCHSNSNGATTSGDCSIVGSEDSQCKDLLMNTVCQLNAKTQHTFPASSQQRHPGVVHIQTKTNDVVPCSENLSQTPFLLSVSQLHTSQYLLLSDRAQDSVTVTTSGCQLHPIPHVSDQPIHQLSQPLQQGDVTLGFRGDNSLPNSHHVPQTVPGQLNVFAHPNSINTLPKSHVMYTNSNDFIPSSCQPGNGNTGHVPQMENVTVSDIHDIINTPYSVETSENFSGLPLAVTCNSNLPVEGFDSGQHVITGNMDRSSEAFNNYQQASVFNPNTSESCNNFQQAVAFSTNTPENGSNNFQPVMTVNANTSGNFSNFPEEMSGNTSAALPLESTDYNILDNLDFEISDIVKLCDDLSGNSESPKDHDMSKDRSCDTELANEINLFNCDLVQSCQGQPDQSFSNISSVCDSKSKENKSCENLKEQKIVDYSPEWASTQGGEKILVVGPWCSLSSQYGCLFDSKLVPTTMVQPGVLRCYSPAHSEGTSMLQVSCDGHLISNSVPFKFVSNNKEQDDWFSITDDELKLLLLERLYVIQEKLKKSTSRLSLQKLREERQSDQFEKKIVLFVKSLVSRPWGNMSDFPKSGKYRMTLLHLAAALGWQSLVHSLIVWRTDNPSWVLDCEVDSHAVDDMSCTPMVWACAKGHRSIVQFLFHWNPDSVDILTRNGLSPSKIAQKYGHISVITELSSLSKGGRKDLISLSREIDSSGKVEQSSVFKTPNSVLGSLHIDIPGQFDHHVRSTVSSKSQIKHSLHQSGSSRRKLAKHFSIDCTPEDFTYIPPQHYDRPVRETNSEPRLCSVSNALTSAKNPMLCNPGRDLTSPDILINSEDARMKAAMMDHSQTPSVHVTGTSCVEMDTDADDNMSDDFSSSAGSPYIDVERVSSDDEDHVTRIRTDRLSINGDNSEDAKRQMVNLAQQIIAAMPMRIKLSPSRVDDAAEFAARERSSSYSSIPSQPSPHASSYEEDSGISTPMGDGFAFDEYRYSDLGTPASSLNSPESTCPYSPYDFKLDSPPPTTEEFTEYFNAPATFMEKDFSLLTLSDQEQRKLYEAAKIIQKTYRKFRNKQMTQQQKEMEAAVLIQKYYRRYKQYAYYKKMTQAAVLIQSQFRSYYAQKRFKKSRDAAVVIQNQYRTYKEHERLKKGGNKSVIIQQRYRSHYQRIPKHVVPNSDGQIVQIVPEGADSTQADQNSTSDNTSQQAEGSETAPSGGNE